ncbi:MAG: hypothetical protein JKX72_04870 [Robiginitomaculum sp.]|nr:hypothetical protein [Robiginitomaculum sp.]
MPDQNPTQEHENITRIPIEVMAEIHREMRIEANDQLALERAYNKILVGANKKIQENITQNEEAHSED